MLTKALVKALERAQRPRSIRALAWMLEKATGTSTSAVARWYHENGYYRLAGGYNYGSFSGVDVTFERALEVSTVLAGIKVIAEDIASLPFFVYRKNRKTDRIEKAYDHPLYRTFHGAANPETSSGAFVEALTAHAVLMGNGYARIQRESDRIWLWPWMPQDVKVERNDRGTPVYYHHEGNGNWRPYPFTDVFHLRGFTLNGCAGDSLLERARHVIGLTAAAEEYAGRFFSSSSMTHLVLERPREAPAVNPEGVELIKKSWKKWHEGLKNAWEPIILQEGMQAKLLQPKHSETQLLEQRTFQVIEICRLLRIPPHRLAELSRSTNNNIEQQSIDYAVYTLGPWRRRWKETVDLCLLTTEDRADADIEIYAEHQLEALLRGDWKTQTEGWAKLLEKGVLSVNDVRRFLNMNPIEGGDAHFIQLNMQSVVDAATGANLPNAQGTGLMPVQ